MKFIIPFLLLFFSSIAASQEGPLIPCVGCNQLVHAPYPETGSWYNPDQSGSGINIEIQNGVLVGYYYGYDADGRSEWWLFHGTLTASEQEGVQWELQTELLHFEDGNCAGCDYQSPTESLAGIPIKLVFFQRSHLQLTLGDSAIQNFVPIIYGSPGRRYFEKQTSYHFPVYGDFFVLALKPNLEKPEPWNWAIPHVYINEGVYSKDTQILIYNIFVISFDGADIPVGEISCQLDQASGTPVCMFVYDYDDKRLEFAMPVGNMSDSRFFGELDSGATVEGYRLGYD